MPDAVETVAEHLIATHVHDNRRRSDDHLVPYRGAIDWDAALMSATAADGDPVIVDGRTVVTGGQHLLGDVGPLLHKAIQPLWET